MFLLKIFSIACRLKFRFQSSNYKNMAISIEIKQQKTVLYITDPNPLWHNFGKLQQKKRL